MRLICPNCAAQYEVPQEVIPEDGRDVQCSACGDTWFQLHPSAMAEPEEPPVEETLPRRATDPDAMRVLREEAALEQAARAAERAPLESQGEMEIPAQEARADRPGARDAVAGHETQLDARPGFFVDQILR